MSTEPTPEPTYDPMPDPAIDYPPPLAIHHPVEGVVGVPDPMLPPECKAELADATNYADDPADETEEPSE